MVFSSIKQVKSYIGTGVFLKMPIFLVFFCGKSKKFWKNRAVLYAKKMLKKASRARTVARGSWFKSRGFP
jgi:hypothetical protein